MKTAIFVVLLVAVGCGPDFSPQPTPAGVDTGFAGRWVGTTTVSQPGFSPFQYTSSVDVLASGSSLTLVGFCPNNTGRISAQGTGTEVTWNGDVACAAPTSSCPSASIHYTAATADLVSAGALNISGSGSVQGCGASLPFTSVFKGVK